MELEADAARRAARGPARKPREAGERVAGGGLAAGSLVGRPVGPELVVGLALLGVGEDLVGLADLLEALLRGRRRPC